nr:murein L,D-transpeptidase catalytic domain family protein [Tardibacter chloracetimidivorans]
MKALLLDRPLISRRQILAGMATAVAIGISPPSAASTITKARGISPGLLDDALNAFDRHRAVIQHRDYIGIADFSLPSWKPRFHIVNLEDGQSRSFLVAHGRGSDPAHQGWLQRFSNLPGSSATSSGAYLTGSDYQGQHGLSQRLTGLDPDNSNAAVRAIVIHSAWYVSHKMIDDHGKLGRSEGCFAFDEADLSAVMSRLKAGRMIYAAKPA